MSPYLKKQKEKRRKNLFRKWHRRVGFSVAIFLANLAITGILLNHSEDLSLHKNYVNSSWIVNFYGIAAPEKTTCWAAQQTSVMLCQIGDEIYIDNQLLFKTSSAINGFVEMDELYFISSLSELYIYTNELELVDKLNKDSMLPTPIENISLLVSSGHNQQSLLLKTSKQYWQFNLDSFNWLNKEMDSNTEDTIVNTKTIKLDSEKRSILDKRYLSHQITYLKIVQDLHSGRIIGLSGKLLTDIVGIIIILLAISGFFAWQRRTEKLKAE